MARVINASYSRLIGSPGDILEFLRLLQGTTAVVDLSHSRFVFLRGRTSGTLKEALSAPSSTQGAKTNG